MKKIFIAIVLILSFLRSDAQSNFPVSVTSLLGLNPSPYIERYYNKPFVLITNSTRSALNVKLVGIIEGNNGLSWKTSDNYNPKTPIILQPGNNVLVANSFNLNFLSSQNIESNLSAFQKKQLFSNGYLPQGTYRFCIRVLDFFKGNAISQGEPLGCSTINISYIKPPQILAPINMGAVYGQFPVFSWATPIGNIMNTRLTYDLYLVKLKNGQNAYEALQNAVNYKVGLITKKEGILTNFYQYLPSDISLEDGQVYAFQIVASGKGLFFENQGKSDVVTFTYRKEMKKVE